MLPKLEFFFISINFFSKNCKLILLVSKNGSISISCLGFIDIFKLFTLELEFESFISDSFFSSFLLLSFNTFLDSSILFILIFVLFSNL